MKGANPFLKLKMDVRFNVYIREGVEPLTQLLPLSKPALSRRDITCTIPPLCLLCFVEIMLESD
jgi:hypothetical protein